MTISTHATLYYKAGCGKLLSKLTQFLVGDEVRPSDVFDFTAIKPANFHDQSVV